MCVVVGLLCYYTSCGGGLGDEEEEEGPSPHSPLNTDSCFTPAIIQTSDSI